MEIEFKMKKCIIFTARVCFRSICSHPFLAGFLCFLIFLHRLSPFMFSLLVSTSPVLISTAVLLGTLLSFGQPNIPEIETDEEIFHETASVMIVEKSQKFDLENVEIMEGEEFTIMNEESVNDGEVVENHYVLIPVNDEHLDLDDESSEPDSSDSERVGVDLPNYPSPSTWTKMEVDDEEEEVDDSLDSGSDLAKSSSPDASTAEIALTLHELHSLLDNEIENSEVGEDDDEEDEQGDEEEETKPVVTWTEEDQKNVMDLGNSEIERNVRLENLMLRMRARKNMRMMMEEMKLIDLASSDLDLPFNVPHIRTTRRNPFDLSHDFPGSAPPILLPRQNPFDIPHEEEPNFEGEGFQEDFTAFQSRERFFRGHGRFSARPSFFASNRQETKEVTEEDLQEAIEVISEIEDVSVGHGSESSEEEESLEDEDENRGVEFDKLEYSRVSSSSSLSEASERVYIEPTNLRITSEVIHGVQFTEPVYDLSPTAVGNNVSSSISFDVHVEPDRVLTEWNSREMENGISNSEMLPEFSVPHPVDELESGPIDYSNAREHENINSDFLGAGVIFRVSIPSESLVENLMDSHFYNDALLNVNNSLLTPDYISVPSIASEAAIPLVDLQIIIEETDENEIKVGDEDILSELDSVGGVSIKFKQWEFVKNESAKDVDLVGGSSLSAHHAQTSTVNTVEMDTTGLAKRSGSSNEENDAHEEGKYNNTCMGEHEEDISNNDSYLRSMVDASLNYKQVDSVIEKNNILTNSGDHILRVVDPAKKELQALEPIPLESTSLLQKQESDENAEKELKQDSTYGPLEVEAHFVDSSMDGESAAKASGVHGAEKHNWRVPATLDLPNEGLQKVV